MKKKLIVSALLAGASQLASAQSSVTIYGMIDMAVVRESGGTAGPMTKVTSGTTGGSRLGFKGTEDLGNGLKALFLLENGFQGDTGTAGQGGLIFGRQVYVGLQGGFGTVLVGRQYTPHYLVQVFADPFGSGWVGDTKNLLGTTGNSFSRMDNTVKYQSPVVSGFSAELVAAPGEVSGDSASGRQLGGSLAWASGPLQVRAGYHNRNNNTATVTGTENAKNWVLAAVYDFGKFRLHGLYDWNRGLNSSVLRNTANPYGRPAIASTDSRDAMVGLSVPFGVHALLASYVYKDDRTAFNQDASQIAIGYRYTLSKRTDFNIAYAKIDNRRGASYTVGSAIESGTGDRAAMVGVRHAF
ncbi:porin [Massilia norwichensis]|uniref:Porin n=1 Tax=Massilia norwichensis TaxID=1442366 RepID=A0ABT2A4T5_9BURK|nr:porin [Massilia norwichensis]MCS0589177.1 porin [Massilia norwichensis]